MSNAAVTTLSPEQARTLFDHLLPTIVQSRALTRELIRHVPDNKLDFQPVAGGETLSDQMWYLASAYDVFLNALCDAKFPELPAKPQPASVQAFLDWDDACFEQTVQRAKAQSDVDLLRPMAFGPFTQPAVEFMTVFLGNMASHTGQLLIGLALVAASQSEVATTKNATADGELNEEELATVAGGNAVYINMDDPGSSQVPNINVVHNYNGPPVIVPQNTQAGLGQLFGNSTNNLYGFVAISPGFGLGIGGAALAQWVMFGTLAFLRL